MKKSLLALALSMAAASGANASWFAGAGPDATALGGNGEALLTVFNSALGKSVGLDTGVRYDDLVSGAAFNGQQINVDMSVFGGSFTGVQWMVTNSSAHYVNSDFTVAEYDKYGYMVTTATNQNRTVGGASGDGWATQLGAWMNNTQNTAQAQLGMNSGAVGANTQVSAATSSDPHYIGNTGWAVYFNNQVAGVQSLGSVGGTMKLTLMGFSDADGAVPLVKDLGTVTLTGTTLTFNSAAPAVPVPAAAWMMGSALLGLGGVARSRKSRA